jgi:hypothetical protein
MPELKWTRNAQIEACRRSGARLQWARTQARRREPLLEFELEESVATVRIAHLHTPSPLNPLGLKGAGEGGTIPAIAAIIAAVENALTPFGVKLAEAPITPSRIVGLIEASRGD